MMTWICSQIVQYCFGGGYGTSGSGSLEQNARMAKWKELNDKVEEWVNERPRTFDPVWESAGERSETSDNPFPDIMFAADWHGMHLFLFPLKCANPPGLQKVIDRLANLGLSTAIAYGFYHLSCILLVIYKPTPRFAIRNLQSNRLRDTDVCFKMIGTLRHHSTHPYVE